MDKFSIEIEVQEGRVKEILDELTAAQETIYKCYCELEKLGVLVIKEKTISQLRSSIKTSVMAEVVRGFDPKYEKTIQSKCKRAGEYGISIQPDALAALMEKFAPDEVEAKKRRRHGKHRLTCKITCRMENELYGLLQQQTKADGYDTVQDCIADLIKTYVGEADYTKGGAEP